MFGPFGLRCRKFDRAQTEKDSRTVVVQKNNSLNLLVLFERRLMRRREPRNIRLTLRPSACVIPLQFDHVEQQMIQHIIQSRLSQVLKTCKTLKVPVHFMTRTPSQIHTLRPTVFQLKKFGLSANNERKNNLRCAILVGLEPNHLVNNHPSGLASNSNLE